MADLLAALLFALGIVGAALARGDLARDLGPAGLRWRRVGPPR